eukprot:2657242-Pyramimonas_sp.AAC.1
MALETAMCLLKVCRQWYSSGTVVVQVACPRCHPLSQSPEIEKMGGDDTGIRKGCDRQGKAQVRATRLQG